LRNITETLARELGHPSERAPGWSAFEWRVARAVAGLHGVSGLLSAQLRWSRRTLLSGPLMGGVDGIAGRGGHTLPAGGWIALRPARPATLLAVRQALAQP
jgi:hypothetical protein